MNDNRTDTIVDGFGSDPTSLQNDLGPVGRALVASLDRAVAMQSSAIESYVHYIRRRNPDASPAKVQKLVDRHFKRLASGAGASAGAAAAIPGIGLATGTAAIASESVLFLDTAAFYTMASAYLRGVDIRNPERRRAIVLVTLLGTKGTAIVDALVGDLGDLGKDGNFEQVNTAQAIGRFSAPKLGSLNNELMNMALRKVSRKFIRGWFGKILPLGIGAAAGAIANRRLAGSLTSNASDSLGPLPDRFLTELPEPKKQERKARKEAAKVEKQAAKAEKAAKAAEAAEAKKASDDGDAGRFGALKKLLPGAKKAADNDTVAEEVEDSDPSEPAEESLTGDAGVDQTLDELALQAITSSTSQSEGADKPQ